VSVRRRERAAGRRGSGGIPPELFVECVPGGFWEDREQVEAWLKLHELGPVEESFFRFPRGLRSECIDQWAVSQDLVNRWGLANRGKIEELGINRGYSKYHIMARHPNLYNPETMNAWRNDPAPF
jgi:hypothetical protein